MTLCDLRQGQREVVELVDSVAGGPTCVETHVECDLVVTGTRGVQPPRGIAHQLEQPAFHRRMNVLIRLGELERPTSSLGLDGLQPTEKGLHVDIGEDPGLPEHADMGHGAGDVVGQ